MKTSIPFVSCNRLCLRVFPLLAALILTGCATVEKRIADNATLFASYPPEVQAKLREGSIDIGYTMPMVEIAWGKPRYVMQKKNQEGEFTSWRYTQLNQISNFVPVDAGYRHGRDWVNITETSELEVKRVDFQQGIVVAFEVLE